MSPTIVVATLLAGAAMLPGYANAQDLFRVTLLGTGTPTARLDRLGPATLVEAGNEKLLFDAGRVSRHRRWADVQLRYSPLSSCVCASIFLRWSGGEVRDESNDRGGHAAGRRGDASWVRERTRPFPGYPARNGYANGEAG